MQMKDIALVALGAAGVIVYQKYKEPMKNKIECMIDTTMERANDKLEKANRKLEEMM